MTHPEKGVARPDPVAFGAGLPTGLTLDLIVSDLDAAARFQAEVLEAQIVYWEDHFAIMRHGGSFWMLHSDWSYRDNPMHGVARVEGRGAGVVVTLMGVDPDAAEARARSAGAVVLDGAADKPHGLREALILDPDGYVFRPCVGLRR